MIKVKFIREDSGFFRMYYRGIEDKRLYCTQPASHLTLPEYKRTGQTDWLVCTRDGEPCHEIKDTFEIVTGKG